jgi:peptide/nickel transport system ATP-binding protein
VEKPSLAGEVFGRPPHPCTQALLDSIPGGEFARKHETSLFT